MIRSSFSPVKLTCNATAISAIPVPPFVFLKRANTFAHLVHHKSYFNSISGGKVGIFHEIICAAAVKILTVIKIAAIFVEIFN
jgi:hypothetical protein